MNNNPYPRRFSKSQRQAIFRLANGKCEDCDQPLKKGWHADHKKPYSKGGATDVQNGRALCPPCNLKKGAKDE